MEVKKKNSILTKKSVKLAIIILIILFMMLVVMLLLGYYVNSQNHLKYAIDQFFDKTNERLNSNSLNEEIDLSFSGSSNKSETLDKLLNIATNTKIHVNYTLDNSNNVMLSDISSTYHDDKLLNVKGYVVENKTYLYLEDIYDKYLIYDSLPINVNNSSDFITISNSLQKAIDKSLKDEYFTKEFVQENDVYLLKTSIKVDNKKYQMIKTDFINYLLSDEKFISSYANVIGKDIEDIKILLTNKLETKEKLKNPVNISLYTKGLSFYKLILVNDMNEYLVTMNDTGYELIYSYDKIKRKQITFNIDNQNYELIYSDKITNDLYKVSFTIKETINGNTLTIPNLEDSKSIDDLTTEESTLITENFKNNDTLNELVEDFIMSFFSFK